MLEELRQGIVDKIARANTLEEMYNYLRECSSLLRKVRKTLTKKLER